MEEGKRHFTVQTFQARDAGITGTLFEIKARAPGQRVAAALVYVHVHACAGDPPSGVGARGHSTDGKGSSRYSATM